MPAPIEQGVNPTFLVTRQDDRPAAEIGRLVVIRLRQLGLVHQIDPSAPEHLHHLLIEEGSIGIHTSVDAVIVHQIEHVSVAGDVNGVYTRDLFRRAQSTLAPPTR